MYITTVFTREEVETMLAGGVVVYTGRDGISRQCEMESIDVIVRREMVKDGLSSGQGVK